MPDAQSNPLSNGGIFALNLTIIQKERLNYRSLFELVQTYRTASDNKFPDFIEFTVGTMDHFLATIGGEGEDGDEFLGIKCLIDPDRVESHNVLQAH